MTTKLMVLSDVHLCHKDWYGKSSRERLCEMVENLCEHYRRRPYEKLLFLGDYSLDHWEHEILGSYLREGLCNTEIFVRELASRLPDVRSRSPL